LQVPDRNTEFASSRAAPTFKDRAPFTFLRQSGGRGRLQGHPGAV